MHAEQRPAASSAHKRDRSEVCEDEMEVAACKGEMSRMCPNSGHVSPGDLLPRGKCKSTGHKIVAIWGNKNVGLLQ
jgi:hypothetical protein